MAGAKRRRNVIVELVGKKYSIIYNWGRLMMGGVQEHSEYRDYTRFPKGHIEAFVRSGTLPPKQPTKR